MVSVFQAVPEPGKNMKNVNMKNYPSMEDNMESFDNSHKEDSIPKEQTSFSDPLSKLITIYII